MYKTNLQNKRRKKHFKSYFYLAHKTNKGNILSDLNGKINNNKLMES